MTETTREKCLRIASDAVLKDRSAIYGGKPENNFKRVAEMWTTYLDLDNPIRPHDVAAMMSLLKIARIASGKYHEDSWVDVAGYAACGMEAQEAEEDGMNAGITPTDTFVAIDMTCENCRYTELSMLQDPCRLCEIYSKWEAKDR